jgi:DNA mismatch repair ATPase MutL
MMNQKKQWDLSLNEKRLVKQRVNGRYRERKWLRPTNWNRFGYLTAIGVFLTVSVTILLPEWLAVRGPLAYSASARGANEAVIVAQQEPSSPPPKEEKEETETNPVEQPELPPEQGEPTNPEELPAEQGEPASPEELPAEQGEPANPEELPAEQGEPASSEELPAEQGEPTNEAESQQEQEESPGGEESQPEQEISLAAAKESLGEEINERYEEWEALRTTNQIWHSASAIATILMTVLITLLGAGVINLPYRKLTIGILGLITILIQFNVSIFLVEQGIAGYKILEEQGSILRDKLESVSTDEELIEIREQFENLILESTEFEE